MFHVDLCLAKRISLVSFHGELSARDFVELDRLARLRSDPQGLHIIFDMTKVEVNTLVTDFVASRGQLPPAFRDFERIYVVPQPDLKLLVRLYIAYQEAQRIRPPLLMTTLDEALARLGAERSEFQRYI